ncbi:MAG: ABC transporter ATP-binding protein [Alphaproteobacteria bacterium]|nr:ABC transporter ATP-binding protein [Alphaproteobacteria bacterium]
MPGPVIELENIDLTLGWEGARVHILRNISLSIAGGQATGIIGPSGSGKSTLLMVMAGIEQPGSGKVRINGVETTGMNEDELARFRGRHIGIVFQSFHLLPTMTALENVAIPLELAGRTDAFQRAREELTHVGLGARLNHYPAQLSGGEQQRVAIARAIAPDPEILIADEPTGNLDDTNGEAIIDLLFRLRRERKATLIIVTHNQALAARCDRMIGIRSGRIESDTTLAPAT